ncbi:MAG: hypothetical protein M1826_001742 [Phylliscum demangeonii]|nr:MAG: hypothetical protein M1826_001742 [Phylliscum demangeonii]
MIYIGLKKWERAVEVLQYVTTTGSQNAPSMIMVAAYKKLVLVSLLRSGRGPRLPRLTNVVERVYQALARPYDRIAEVFAQGNHDILWQEIQAGQPIWEADRNVGLIHLVLNALPVFLVRRYAKTYSTISIAQVSDWLSRGNSHAASASASNDLSAVEERIAQMISSGEILARLSRHPSAALASPTHKHSTAANSTTTTIPSYSSPPPPPPHPSSTITFSPLDPDTTILNASETSHAAQLKAQLCRLNQLSAQLKVIDSKLAFSKEFVAHTIKSNPSDRPHKGNRSVHQGAGPATGEDDYMHDAPSFPSGWGAPRANAGGGGGGGDADGGGSSRPYNGAGSFADEVFDEDVMADL